MISLIQRRAMGRTQSNPSQPAYVAFVVHCGLGAAGDELAGSDLEEGLRRDAVEPSGAVSLHRVEPCDCFSSQALRIRTR